MSGSLSTGHNPKGYGAMLKSVFVGGLAFAAAVGAGSAQAGPCPTVPTSSSVYTASGFSCSVGTLTFSSMSISPSTSGDGTIGPISVTPLVGVLGGDGLELTFSAAASFPPGGTADIAWTYDVTSTVPIVDAGLSLTGSGLSGATVALSETLDPIGKTLSASSPGSPSETITFAGVSSLSVTKDLANVALSSGTAVSSIVQNTFSTHPISEPTTIALLGAGLLGLGLSRRSRGDR
jgi:hypothetical protein